jgi:transposase
MMPTPHQVWLVVEPIDMRIGIDGLSQKIQNTLGRTPCDGSAYAFRNKRQHRLKLLIWDGTGVWLCQRRLHRGQFKWPDCNTPTHGLTAEEWAWLITGVDWQRLKATPPSHWQV